MSIPTPLPGPRPLRPGILAACPPRLAERIDAGAEVMIDARFSTSAGNAAYLRVAKNARAAARLLRDQQILDVTHLMPDEATLRQELANTTDVERNLDEEGRRFTNRYRVMRLPGGLTLLMSCGSGRKIVEEEWHVPAIKRSAREVRGAEPALFFAAEFTRWGRDGFAFLPLVRALRRLEQVHGGPVFTGDGLTPVREFDRIARLNLFMQADAADAEAELMDFRTGVGRAGDGPLRMELGRVEDPTGQAAPPGFGHVWLLDRGRSARGKHTLYLDCPAPAEVQRKGIPACRPEPHEVVYGLPSVYRPDKQGGMVPVDQVHLVRWYWAHRYRPGWPKRRCAEHIAAQGYSTEGKRHGDDCPDATWGHDGKLSEREVDAICRSLDLHLDLFVSGVLVRGEARFENLFPLDGPWMSAEDAARNRRGQAAGTAAHTLATRHTFGGQPVLWQGRACILVGEVVDGQVLYRLRGVEPAPAQWRPRPTPLIPAVPLGRSLVAWFAEAEESLLPLLPPMPTDVELQDDTASQLAATRREIETTKEAAEQRWQALFPSSGPTRLRKKAFERAQAEYERHDARLSELYRDEERLTDQLAADNAESRRRAVAVAQVLRLMASLGDPHDVTYHGVWRAAIRDFAVDATAISRAGVQLITTTWSFIVVLDDGAAERMVRVHGEHTRVACPASIRRLLAIERQLRDGIPLDAITRHGARKLPALRLLLGLQPTDRVIAATVPDPRILRITMEIQHPALPHPASSALGVDELPLLAGPPLRSRQLYAASRRLAEPPALVRRVAEVQADSAHSRRPARSSGDAALAEVFARAAINNGVVLTAGMPLWHWVRLRHAALHGRHASEWSHSYGRLVLRPCPHCGSYWRVPLLLREATEPVCYDCTDRLDTTGIPWPGDDYDRWIVRPDVWQRIAPDLLPPAGDG